MEELSKIVIEEYNDLFSDRLLLQLQENAIMRDDYDNGHRVCLDIGPESSGEESLDIEDTQKKTVR
jgi:hypothetical protein